MPSANQTGRMGWWLAQSGVIAMGLLLAVWLSPELGVLVLTLCPRCLCSGGCTHWRWARTGGVGTMP